MRVRIFIAGLVAGTVLGAAGASAVAWKRPATTTPTPAATSSLADVGTDVLRKAADIESAQKRWEELHSLCRGGGGDDPLTLEACDEREELAARLKQLGYCFHMSGADEAPSDYAPLDGWQRCDTLEHALARSSR